MSQGAAASTGAVPNEGAAPSADPRLSINQATIKHAPLAEVLKVATGAGVASVGLWRESVQEVGLGTAAKMLADSGLRVSSHCRGGFFTMVEGASRRASIDDNRRAIDETRALAEAAASGSVAELVLVAGGLPEGSRDLIEARARVQDALAELVPYAQTAGVRLAIEPLHPMYASDRAVVSTLGQALDIAGHFDASAVGVVVDTFHIWWDPEVLTQIARAGAAGRISSYQVCDWKTPLPADVLLARHYPGEGVIDFASLTTAVREAGYSGDVEVEIFNADVWNTPPGEAVRRTVASFNETVSPHLAKP